MTGAPGADPAASVLPKLPQLDGLRAFAVGAVLIHHFAPPDSLLSELLPWGWLGVKLFFVISGFLITSILIQCRELAASGRETRGWALRRFYARRCLRIIPLYYFALLAAAALDLYPVRDTLAWHLLFASNFYFAKVGAWTGAANHLWSLAVEEQFYLLWPWLIVYAPQRRLVPLVLGCVATAVAWRIGGVALGFAPISILVLTPACLDTLGMGSLLALVWRRGELRNDPDPTERLTRRCLQLGAPLMTAVLVLYWLGAARGLRTVASDLAMALCFTWLVSRAATGFRGWAGRVLSFGPVQYLGRISYGIYVYHLFLWSLVPTLGRRFDLPLPVDRVEAAFLVAALTVATAAVSWHAFERPVNGLKRHFPYAAPVRTTAP